MSYSDGDQLADWAKLKLKVSKLKFLIKYPYKPHTKLYLTNYILI